MRRKLAEREGFEPPETCASTVFKTAAFDHSAISPERDCTNWPPAVPDWVLLRRDRPRVWQNAFMPEHRLFSEEEAAQIIRRAVEISDQELQATFRPGITPQELERIAAEVGVSASALAQALRETAREETSEKGLLHLTEEFVRVVEGELDPKNFDLVVEGIKPLANAGQPHMAQVGRTLTMSAWVGAGQARIEVTSRKGRTKLKVKSNALFQALMTLHPAFITSVILVGALSEQGLGWLAAGLAAGVLTLGGLCFNLLTKFSHRRARALADELRDRIAEAIETAPQE